MSSFPLYLLGLMLLVLWLSRRSRSLLSSTIALALVAVLLVSVRRASSNTISSETPPTGAVIASLDAEPDVVLDRIDGDELAAETVGAGVLNDDARQTLSPVLLPGQTHTFLAHIKNTGQSAATFSVNFHGPLSSTGAATVWKPAGWTATAVLQGTTTSILAALQSASGWTTPSLDPGKEAVVRLSLTSPTSAAPPAGSFRMGARNGGKTDAVLGEAGVQSIAKLQWSVDNVTWTDVGATTLVQAGQTDVIGVRAVKRDPALEWPSTNPLGPSWTFHNDTFSGEAVWLHADDLTTGDSEDATATLGETLRLKIKVVPGDAFITFDKDAEDN